LQVDNAVVIVLGAGTAAFGLVAAALWPLVGWLRRRALLDIPNHRSSHVVPTPRGGGIAVVAVILPGWLVVAADGPPDAAALTLLAGALGVAALSWVDDLRDLPRRLRFAVQAVAVGAVLVALPAEVSVTQGLLPPVVERPVIGLAWLWFINLYNFMDGIDGLCGVETVHLGLGVAVLGAMGLAQDVVPSWPVVPWAALVAGAAAGFLPWNWHPAKVFMGDVGSVALGFLLGGLLFVLAAGGAWLPALILPAYYLADATLTLGGRVLRGQSPIEAHREHAYQRASRRLGHDGVVWRVAACNLVLLGAAVLAARGAPWLGAGLAVATVAATLRWLGAAGAAATAVDSGEARAE
jgi:UDP-N-acetylmuramyl pentapeptide phosphotransferase/UDP-N-acetylglucosamine-1-phosphate transferase